LEQHREVLGICIDFASKVGYRFVSINKRFGTKKISSYVFIGSGQVNLIRISLGIFHFI
jgi:hypothetical protein